MTKVKITFNDSGKELSVQVKSGTEKWKLSIPWDITTARRAAVVGAQEGDSHE
jgi:hypothetical protein